MTFSNRGPTAAIEEAGEALGLPGEGGGKVPRGQILKEDGKAPMEGGKGPREGVPMGDGKGSREAPSRAGGGSPKGGAEEVLGAPKEGGEGHVVSTPVFIPHAQKSTSQASTSRIGTHVCGGRILQQPGDAWHNMMAHATCAATAAPTGVGPTKQGKFVPRL